MAGYPQSRNGAFQEGVNGGPALQQADPAFHAVGPLMVGNAFKANNGMAEGTYGFTEPYDRMMIQQAKSGGGENY